ncbi:hypothetical protein [Streptomyces sp. NPDC127084]|uniref:hypothetical protein n=1 Tax=Streptomyces sp. NPDC127084 TaxID=3347133 RepID=UPI0036478C53
MFHEESMRQLLGPVAAVALIAQANPDLPAPRIEIAPIHRDVGNYSAVGVKLLMYQPEDGVYERWAHLIGSSDPDSHTDPGPAQHNNKVRRTYGTYAATTIELIAYVSTALPLVIHHDAQAASEPAV